MNWLDIVLLGILALSAFNGFMNGFFRSVTGLFSVGLGFTLALKIFRPVSDYFDYDLGWGDRLAEFLMTKLGAPQGTVAGQSTSTELAAVNTTGAQPAGFPGVPDMLAALVKGQMTFWSDTTVRSLASSVLDVLSFLAIFILVAAITSAVFGTVPKLPLLAPLDKAGGFCFGLLRGFLYGLVIVAVVRFLGTTGIFFGPNFFSDALSNAVLAPSYVSFLNYLWSLIVPAALDWPGADRFLYPSRAN
ncbi:MAG: CvpA family protein [Peptococcaceae bacterium]|nr:CvpA family protein [Peptococcaceae bacterium]